MDFALHRSNNLPQFDRIYQPYIMQFKQSKKKNVFIQLNKQEV